MTVASLNQMLLNSIIVKWFYLLICMRGDAMKRDFNSIMSNTDDREESSWFVLLFFKSA